MTPEMYEIGPDIKSTSANNSDVLSMKTALYLYPVFAQGFGFESQSSEYYFMKTGKKAGRSSCQPSQKIPFPPRAIQWIDPQGVLHHRKPFLPGACQACFSYDHKEFSKDCVMTDFCRTCGCYFPDEEHGSHGHACTTGITGSGNATKGKSKGKGKLTGKGKGKGKGNHAPDAAQQAKMNKAMQMQEARIKKANEKKRKRQEEQAAASPN